MVKHSYALHNTIAAPDSFLQRCFQAPLQSPQTQDPASAQPLPLPATTVTQHIEVEEGSASTSRVKHGNGRPKKAAPSTLQSAGITGKKSPGRPRKVTVKNVRNSDAIGARTRLKLDGTPAKPRGRPPKKNVSNAAAQDASAPGVTGGFLAPVVYVGEGVIDPATTPVSLTKRRGRLSLKVQNSQN